MADSNILIQLEVVQKGNKLSVVAKDTEKLSKSTDKATASSSKLEKQSGKTYGRFQQGAIGTANATKSFSKLNQTIGGGGSGGAGALVGAYAVLAANIFAVTAAFNAFRGAAGVDKLTEGLEAFSNTTGQSLDLVARRLQETTGNAVSFEQAMRTAALSTSAGFGTEEMEGLTRVAKGASLALGRDMGDALDRLTRGAIKLEPEILDELGIMVRLDDATETFAATLGKAASQLTRFERQQAFMNAIISEGEDKFGAIADAIDPNVYDQLGAAFADLSKDVLSFLNLAITPLIGLLIKMPTVFLGAVAVFSGGIIKRMIPAFGDMAQSAKNAAMQARMAIEESIAAGVGQNRAIADAIKPNKEALPAFDRLFGKIKQGTATTKELTTAQRSLGQRLGKLNREQEEYTKQNGKANASLTRRINLLKQTRAALQQLQGAQVSTQAQRAFGIAQANEAFAERNIGLIAEAQRQTFGYRDRLKQLTTVFKGVSASAKQYFLDLVSVNSAHTKGKGAVLFFRNALAFLQTGFKTAGLAARTFGIILLNSIPIIGQIIFFGSILFEIFKKVAKMAGFFTEESERAKQAQADLDGVLATIPDKMQTIADQQERATTSTALMTKEYKILGGLVKTVAEEATRAQRALDAAGDGMDDVSITGPVAGNANRGGRAQKIQAARDKRNLDNIRDASKFAQALSALEEQGGKTEEVINQVFDGQSVDQFILKQIAGGTAAVDLQKKLRQGLEEVQRTFDGISQVNESLVSTFREAEKEAGKFIRKTAESTSFDLILANLDTASNQITELQKQAAEAGADANALLAESALQMGKNVRLLVGPETVQATADLKNLETELIAARKKLLNASRANKEEAREELNVIKNKVKEQQKIVALAIEEELPARVAILKILQSEEIQLKSSLKLIRERIKGNNSVTKSAKAVENILALENLATQKQIQQIKLVMRLREGEVSAAREALAQGKVLNKEQEAALDLEASQLIEIRALTNKIIDDEVIKAESLLSSLKLREQELKVQKELNNVINTGLKLRQEISKQRDISFGLPEEDTAAKNARLTAEASEQALKLAREEAELKFAVISAEHKLLQAKRQEQLRLNEQAIADIRKQVDERGRLESRLAELEAKKAAAGTNLFGGSKEDPDDRQERISLETELEVSPNRKALEDEIQLYENVNNAIQEVSNSSTRMSKTQRKILNETLTNIDRTLEKIKGTVAASLGEDLFGQQEGGTEIFTNLETIFGDIETASQKTGAALFNGIGGALGQLGQLFQSTFGEEGIMLSSFTAFAGALTDTIGGVMEKFKTLETESGLEGTALKLEQAAVATQGVANVIGALNQMQQQRARAATNAIDQEIAAEKKRDGKSAESQKKIEALEKKKEQIKRKAFEQEKKLNIAQTIMNTATGIMKGIAQGGILGFVTAGIIAAMGAAQVAMIKSQTYQGGGQSASTAAAPSNLSIGERTNEVNVANQANRGELAYLRGEQGQGSVSNFTPGAAAGRKGYANGSDGVVVGERGPEIITPSMPVDIIPNDQIQQGITNVNFTIHAVDAAGLEQTIQSQRGNIIGMIRDAANGFGEPFLEGVDTDTLTGDGGSY